MKPKLIFEAAALDAAFWMFMALPPRMASQLGGKILRSIGPLLKGANKRIDRNIAKAFPDWDEAHRTQVRMEMWSHFGMIAAEYPHLKNAYNGHKDFVFEHVGTDHMHALPPGPIVFVSAHIGNWEMLPLICFKNGYGFHSVYRAPNNPYVAETIEKLRSIDGLMPKTFPKSRLGVKLMSEALKKGENVAFLIDQRHSKGAELSFFGHKVNASTAAVDLAKKYGATIVMGRIKRLGPCHFSVEVEAPITVPQDADTTAITQGIYNRFEDWITDTPEQWLWSHNRWGKTA